MGILDETLCCFPREGILLETHKTNTWKIPNNRDVVGNVRACFLHYDAFHSMLFLSGPCLLSFNSFG